MRSVRIGVDTGGTFTDVVVVDEQTGEITTTKTPSTPANPADGFMEGVRKVLRKAARSRGGGSGPQDVGPEDVGMEAVSAVVHGTTVATNQLLEDRIADLGFVTTEGFEFVLEIARQSVPDGYGNSYFWVKPPRIVPVHRIRTVGGRLDHTGAEVRPFDEEQAVAAARWFRERGIIAIGVCFLHSYANPAHEVRMREVIEREHPDAVVSISSDVLREYREYERSVTTLVDAAVKPTMRRYIANLAERLEVVGRAVEAAGRAEVTGRPEKAAAAHATGSAEEAAASGTTGSAEEPAAVGAGGTAAEPAAAGAGGSGRLPFSVMKSNGGVLSAAEVVHQPITTVLSGPAAGALGAALIAATAGHPSVITLDGGGTSTDVAVVVDGEPSLTTEGSIGRYPCKIPMIDIVTVGAGGGSIAWISPEGTLKVGPRSAGADPGPLCYGRGGTEVTVTDAHVFLGRVPPHLLGGEIPLDAEAARHGIEALAGKLGLTPERTATGILEISAFNQSNAIRQITVKRGLDVRDFPMVAFGGSGPLLVCRLIDILGLPSVIVPPDPGNVSAFGLLTVDVKNDYVRTFVTRDLSPEAAAEIFGDLEEQAAAALDREGFPAEAHVYARSADLRYYGQAYEVRVPAPAGPPDEAWRAEVLDRFHIEHHKLYGYGYRDDPRHGVEWVNLRVSGIGPITRPAVARRPHGTGRPEPAGFREVCYDGWGRAPVHRRADLSAGARIDGPAVVEEYGSTLPVHPGFTATMDEFGNLEVRRA